jgi:hypothetical protein
MGVYNDSNSNHHLFKKKDATDHVCCGGYGMWWNSMVRNIVILASCCSRLRSGPTSGERSSLTLVGSHNDSAFGCLPLDCVVVQF